MTECITGFKEVLPVDNFWTSFLAEIEKKTSSHTFKTWFQPLKLISFSSDSLSIGVPKLFFAEWLQEKYDSLIKEVTYTLTKSTPEIKFEVCGDLVVDSSPDTVPAVVTPVNVFPIPKNINANYVFSNFIVGASNQFAHAACLAVADNPGGQYNPLFIYSGSGLGKTHLLHAIVHHCYENKNNYKIFYISSENFTNELINSIRYEKMADFRKKYRSIDVLLLDDIQFIAGKERTQEEFFHTFNSLFEIKKQIVVTSDKTPREIDDLEDRLRSRFEWGLIADIQPPETETKVAILKKKALNNSFHLPNEVAFFLAESVKSNIRELEGLLTRLTAYSSLYGCDITLDFTKEVLSDFIKKDDLKITPEKIQKTVAKFFNVKVSDLKSKKKNSSIVLPRQIAMFLMRSLTDLSFPEIGLSFGGKDHSTVIYSIRKVEKYIKNDKKIKESVDFLIKNF